MSDATIILWNYLLNVLSSLEELAVLRPNNVNESVLGYQTCKVWCSYLHSHLWWHSNEIHLPSYQNLACAIGKTEYEFNWMNWKSWHFFIMLLHLTFYHWILTWEIMFFQIYGVFLFFLAYFCQFILCANDNVTFSFAGKFLVIYVLISISEN